MWAMKMIHSQQQQPPTTTHLGVSWNRYSMSFSANYIEQQEEDNGINFYTYGMKCMKVEEKHE